MSISFSEPEQLGTVLSVNGNEFELHAKDERLTDSFLNELIKAKGKFSFTLYTDNFYTSPVELVLDSEMSITTQNSTYRYDVSLQEFRDAFVENVRKNALYYAAPCNYRAFFYKSDEDKEKQFARYQEDAAKILAKINH